MHILLTGASGGIGKAVAEYFSQNGHTVYALDVKSIQFNGENIRFLQASVTDETALKSIRESLQKDGLQLDAIVNIAGVFDIDSFIEMPTEKLKTLFEINLFGAMLVNKTFHSLLKKDGRILITTSEVAPLDPLPFNGVYGVSKTALDAYAQALRQELNLLGQKVITIRPGAFRTPLSQGALEKTKELTNKTRLYKGQSSKFYALVKGFMGNPKPPELLAPVYLKALTAKKPKLVYKKHTNPLLVLLNILPKRLQCFAVKTLLKTK